ncbi:polysaccharide deacetylase family protein, partial [Shigella flexneri]|nr:polysaccharide deacetylase family protein [Shigella flexneri]
MLNEGGILFKANHVPVLMYHHVSHCPGLVTLSPVTFRKQIKWLAENNWKTLSSDELEFFYRGGKLPRKSVMLTFDDGYLDNWFQVYPLLNEFNLKAHIFLITSFIG